MKNPFIVSNHLSLSLISGVLSDSYGRFNGLTSSAIFTKILLRLSSSSTKRWSSVLTRVNEYVRKAKCRSVRRKAKKTDWRRHWLWMHMIQRFYLCSCNHSSESLGRSRTNLMLKQPTCERSNIICLKLTLKKGQNSAAKFFQLVIGIASVSSLCCILSKSQIYLISSWKRRMRSIKTRTNIRCGQSCEYT